MADIEVGPNEYPFYENNSSEGSSEPSTGLLQGPGSALNSDTLDGYQLSPAIAPQPNTVIPLNEAGEFPDSVIPDTANAVGSIVQTVISYVSATDSTSTSIPFDTTIPQNTEGKEYTTVSITPTAAGNLLRATAMAHISGVGTDHNAVAIFRDTTADAIAVGQSGNWSTSVIMPHLAMCDVSAGSVSATTFKARFGGDGGTTYLNSFNASGQKYGGVAYSWLKVEEIKQ